MSKFEYKVNVDEYICTALEYIRKMHETRDYSSLIATVERIQFHANSMEDAISSSFDKKWRVIDICDDDDISDKEFREKVKDIMKKHT